MIIAKQNVTASEKQLASSTALRVFQSPDLDSRPMARMWFPDAGAGATDNDCIEKQLRSMAEGGIGGVEVALLGDDTGNLNAKDYGWGTPNWVKTMKKVLKAAAKIEGGFKVDFTITSHWPPIVNTIDPNDEAASSNMVYTWKKLRPGETVTELPLPETNLFDSGRNPFIFKDTLCGVITATVANAPLPELKPMGFGPMDQSGLHHFGPERTMFDGKVMGGPAGSGGPPPMEAPKHAVPFVLELSSLKNVTDKASPISGKGWACGVPDEEALEKWYDGKITLAQVEDVFGPPADESNMLPDGKRDKDLNRKRMADFQPVWQLDITDLVDSAAEEELPQPGDTVVIACYYRGTGQIFSGGFKSRLMKNMTYAANYFTVSGTRAITDYWDTYILSDSELRQLMEDNAAKVGGAIFEDSIELHSNGANWSAEFKDDISARMGCDAVTYMPVYVGLYFDDVSGANRILEEYKIAEGGMYQENHIEYINRWAAGFGYSYRAQAGMAGVNSIGANTATGITEGDNGTFKDANRRLAGCVNMVPEKKFLSFESNTFTGFPFPWSLLAQECHYDASNGTNRIIFHGTAYCKNVNDFYDWWPGWNWGGGGGKAYDFMAWDKRICWWDDAHVMTDYLSRLCGILQNAQAKVDAAVLHAQGEGMMVGQQSMYGFLADRGYTYNVLGDYTLTLPTAVVTNNRLYEDGPGYRVLLLKDMDALRYETALRVMKLAEDGLPVVFDGKIPSRVRGMEKTGSDDAALKQLMTRLTGLANVYTVSGEMELLELLDNLHIVPGARYTCHNVEATHMQDAAGDYYAFYNDTLEAVSIPVSLMGTGTLVRMDCWNGQLIPVPNEDLRFTLELAPQDMKFFAILPIATATSLAVEAADAIIPDTYDVKLESFGPALETDSEYDPYCPIESHRETITKENIAVGTPWSELPVAEDELDRLRVGSMADVSGRAWYTVEFDLPQGTEAIEIAASHNDRDFLIGGEINGKPLPCFNCMDDRLLLTEGFKPGKNTLILQLDSILTNRLNYESPGYLAKADLSLMSFGGGNREYHLRHRHGLESLVITPYL